MKNLIKIMFITMIASTTFAGNDYNFRFSPISALVGIVNTELDVNLNSKWTVGPAFSYINLNYLDIDVKGTSIGVQSRYYFKQFKTDGWYISPKAYYASAEASITSLGVKYTGSTSAVYLAVGSGYHWFWDSFNMNFGGGLILGDTNIEVKDSNGKKYPSTASAASSVFLEYTIGWTF